MAEILRFFIAPGHGLSNAVCGRFDVGASSQHGSEYDIVSRIAVDLFDRLYRDETEFSVVLTPVCSTECESRHPKRRYPRHHERAGHLAYTVQHINESCAPFDMVLSLHMNSAPSASSTGVEVLYYAGAPSKRRRQAAMFAETFAREIGLPNRGAKPDTESARGSLAILRDTDCPAILVEMGFVTNPTDVDAVKCGAVDALVTAMKAVRGVK